MAQIQTQQGQKAVAAGKKQQQEKTPEMICKENCEKDILEVRKMVSSGNRESVLKMAEYLGKNLGKGPLDEVVDTYEKLVMTDKEHRYAKQTRLVKDSYAKMVKSNMFFGQLNTKVKELGQKREEIPKAPTGSGDGRMPKVIIAFVLIGIMLFFESAIVTGWIQSEHLAGGIAEGFLPVSIIIIALGCYIVGLLGCFTSLLIAVAASAVLGLILLFAGGVALVARVTVAIPFIAVALWLIINAFDGKTSKKAEQKQQVIALNRDEDVYKEYAQFILSEITITRQELLKEGLKEKYVDHELGYQVILSYYHAVIQKLDGIKK